MSSFFEFLDQSDFMHAGQEFHDLIARGLQLTLFHHGVNIQRCKKKIDLLSRTPNFRIPCRRTRTISNPKPKSRSTFENKNLERYRRCDSWGGKELMKIARQKRSSPNWIGVVYQQQVDGIEPPLLARVQKTFPPSPPPPRWRKIYPHTRSAEDVRPVTQFIRRPNFQQLKHRRACLLLQELDFFEIG